MDYKGYNDIDEEELDPNNPWDTASVKRVKRIFKILFYSISFIIYAALFFVIFTSCDPGMFDKMFFTEKTRSMAQQSPDTFKVYKVQTKDFMNYDGSVELANIYYAKDSEELEVGVKFNLKKLTNGKIEDALIFILKDSNGNYYTTVNEVYDSNRKYGYARVTFSSVKLDLQQNVYFKYTESYDYSSVIKANEDKVLKTDGAAKESENEADKGIVYELYIYSYDYFLSKDYVSKDDDGNITIDFTQLKEDKDLTEITKHEIYSNNTVITLEKYKYE
jgi:hypothetical protein